MDGRMNLEKLSLEELAGVVNIYPWFSLARKELCMRMARLGEWGTSQYSEAALYMGDRRILSSMLRNVTEDCSDRDISEIVDRFVEAAAEARREPDAEEPVARREVKRPRFAGADYFSQSEYARVRRESDSLAIDYSVSSGDASPKKAVAPQESDVCTEILARIYLEQGYPEEAKAIYSKLLLAYPEKSTYFASLIEKIDEIKN